VVFLDQRQRLFLDGFVFNEESFDILRHEIILQGEVTLEFEGSRQIHTVIVCFHISSKGGNIFAFVFRPKVGFLVEDEEISQFLQAHWVNVLE